MKVFASTGILVVLVAVAMRLGIAEPPAGEVEATPQPLAPELWNVFGERDMDGVRVTLRPIVCPIEAGLGRLCAEVSGNNPSAEQKDLTFEVKLFANNDSGMSRLSPPPQLIESSSTTLQVPAGATATNIVAFTPPSPLPLTLTLSLTAGEGDPMGDTWMASLSSLYVPGSDPVLTF